MRLQSVTGVAKTLVASCALLAGLVGSAQAGSVTINGTIDATDPVLAVVTISTPDCVSQGTFLNHHEAVPFTVDVSGAYSFSMTSPIGRGALYLFENSFNPAAPLATCVAGDNTGDPVEFSFGLTAGTTYIAVPFDDAIDQSGVVYALTIAGRGDITLTSVPEPENMLLVGTALLALVGFGRPRRRVAR